ncbi:MAG: peptidylprolyl isomerase [Planctomycetales bacterium]|nr:peptidylprolyl isomerase [Planctomycetales bacterium]
MSVTFAALVGVASGQPTAKPTVGPAAPAPAAVAVASVNGHMITAADVERQVERVVRGRDVTAAARTRLLETAREQLISRQLILAYLHQHQAAPSKDDIDVELTRISKRLTLEEKTLDDYLKASRLDERQLRELLRWQLGWQWYLDRYLTDENLSRYYEQHRLEHDGSELRVAHILFKADPADGAAMSAAVERATAVRGEIESGKLTFSAAAKRHSDSPQADQGGELGWITRRAPMPEVFSRAAYQLQVSQVSPPVSTAFGVHLIQCLEIKAGKKRWQDVRPELESAVTAHLFSWVADQQRSKAKIERMPFPSVPAPIAQ